MLEPGTRLGPYEILSQIGAGGMGEVYKGRDTRLDRLVALKLLAPHLAANREARERFEREATTVAKLKHAHICLLYDIGKDQGRDYLVFEYLEGETLSQRLAKGPLPLDHVLQYAIEIADALDKAHRAGVTHRDIKPGNIMVVPSSETASKTETKLLDFGLAKLKQDVVKATIPPSELPTVPGALTQGGTILGTLHYMAPEQLESKEVDGRADIFSFGAVVHEMATGKRAFPGETQASIIAKILDHNPPPVSSLEPPGKLSPPALDRVIEKCLRKDREGRWQSARDVTEELKWIKDGGRVAMATGTGATAPQKAWRRAVPWAAAVVVSIAVGIGGWILKPSQEELVSRLTITLPPGQRLAALDQPAIAISPDGKNLVYVAVQSRDREGAAIPATGQGPLADARGSDTGTQQLYLRPLDSQESKPMAGTEGAVGPFFSPDGQWIGFFAGGKLKKVSVNGGAAVTLANAPNPGGASWSSQGTLASQAIIGGQGLQQVPQEGGAPQLLTRVGKGEFMHRWPEWLPNGQAVLFAASPNVTNWSNAQIAVQVVETGERRNLVQGGTQPRYASSGHLLYAQAGTLMAAPFDLRKLAMRGAGAPVLEGVLQSPSAAQYSVSATGTLVYVAGDVEASQRRLTWVSRNGEEQALLAPPHSYQYPRVSPDGRRVAVGIIDEQERQVWLYDLARDTLTRLTFEGNENFIPAWTPDGKRVAFRSNRAGPPNLFWQLADGSGGLERLTTSDYNNSPSSFSPDGQLLAFHEAHPTTGRDIWVLRLSDPSASSGQGHKAQPFLRTQYDEAPARFSPDGRWLAYSSNESGRYEVYVQPYPGPGGKWLISTEGGGEPLWNPHGRELFYRSGNKMMAVEVTTQPGFAPGKPRLLFEGAYTPTTALSTNYDVSPDGQRFLMLKPVESQTSAPTQINVVLNWFEELKRRVPVP